MATSATGERDHQALDDLERARKLVAAGEYPAIARMSAGAQHEIFVEAAVRVHALNWWASRGYEMPKS